MGCKIVPLTERHAEEIITWEYPPPYQRYSLSPEDKSALLNPSYRYHAVESSAGSLIGMCCFGADARVEGGDYVRGEPRVLDVGLGLHPELTGRGFGREFVWAVLSFAGDRFQPETFRVTIADFNQRSVNTFQKFGFKETFRFRRFDDQEDFVQLQVPAEEALEEKQASGKKLPGD